MSSRDPGLPQPRPRGKIALASLLFGMAVIAVLAAALRIAWDNADREALAWAAGGGLLFGVLAAAGLLGARRPTAGETFAGIAIGAVFGPMAGILMVAPQAFPALAIGSAVLVAFAFVVRKLSAPAAAQDPDDPREVNSP